MIIIVLHVFEIDILIKELLINNYKIIYSIGTIGIGAFALGIYAIRPHENEKGWSRTQIFIGGIGGFTVGLIFLTLSYSWLDTNDFKNGDIFIEYNIFVSIGILLLVLLIGINGLRHYSFINRLREFQRRPVEFDTNWPPLAYFSTICSVIVLFLQ
ncbi:MAG: hypothetical protein EAX86_03190 [Candidatus Heimdallarchaeota archaeon]|nr:hypothetical protein [Candidatus Heimdallarchaeota archaeon]